MIWRTFLLRLIVVSASVLVAIIVILLYCLKETDVVIIPQPPQKFISFCGSATDFGDQASGKELFNTTCAACHRAPHAHSSFSKFTERFGNSFFQKYIAAEDSLIITNNKYV